MPPIVVVLVVLAPALGCLLGGYRMMREAMRRPVLLIEDVVLGLAWLFAIGSLVWLSAYLGGSTLLGFGEPWTWLTAAHFGAAGFGAWTITAWLIRTVPSAGPRRILQVLLFVHPVAFACVAAGITGAPYLDELGAPVYGSLFTVQALVYSVAARPRGSFVARALLTAALWVPVATLVPAVGWAWGRPLWNLAEMVRYHGLVNAVGHVALGLASLAWLRPPRRLAPLAAPLSRLCSRGRLEANFLDDLRSTQSTTPAGLSDDLDAYSRPGFAVADLHPDVVAFYEHTAEFELDLSGRWHPPFRAAGWIWTRVVAPALGQLGLPGPGHDLDSTELQSRIVDVDDRCDGRQGVRGWVRLWRRSQRTLYVAAYAEHVREGVRYMNIAFPLPRANLTSILHLAPAPGGGLQLTSRHDDNFAGDQGVYLVSRAGNPWRLPLDETIWVFSASRAPADLAPTGDSVLVARHVMWCCGLRYATLTYQIRRTAPRSGHQLAESCA